MSNGEPNGEPAVDPVAVHEDPFADEPIRIDAPMEVKRRFLSPTVGVPVRRPGEAETVRPLPPNLAPRAAVRGQHNWVPIGPRNVGGRVRAIAIQPGNRADHVRRPGIRRRLQDARRWRLVVPAVARRAVAVDGGARDLPGQLAGRLGGDGGGRVARRRDFIAAAGVLRSANGGSGVDPDRTRARPSSSTRIHALAAHPTNVNVLLGGRRGRPLPHDRRRPDVAPVRCRASLHRRCLLDRRAGPPPVRRAPWTRDHRTAGGQPGARRAHRQSERPRRHPRPRSSPPSQARSRPAPTRCSPSGRPRPRWPALLPPTPATASSRSFPADSPGSPIRVVFVAFANVRPWLLRHLPQRQRAHGCGERR